MRNQFGQEIEVGDWVGYASKTGSTTSRKIGKVTGFGERKRWDGTKLEDVVLVNWLANGTWRVVREVNQKGTGVGINRLFKLDPTGLPPGSD